MKLRLSLADTCRRPEFTASNCKVFIRFDSECYLANNHLFEESFVNRQPFWMLNISDRIGYRTLFQGFPTSESFGLVQPCKAYGALFDFFRCRCVSTGER